MPHGSNKRKPRLEHKKAELPRDEPSHFVWFGENNQANGAPDTANTNIAQAETDGTSQTRIASDSAASQTTANITVTDEGDDIVIVELPGSTETFDISFCMVWRKQSS